MFRCGDRMNVPQVIEIKKIIEETPTIKTFIFDWTMVGENIPSPGQFVMVWNFKDEKPMSISYIDVAKGELGITVKKVGEFTEDLHTLKEGDKLGLRGPYGNGFDTDLRDMRVLAIGGGVGMAPIASFTEAALKNKAKVDVVCAAQTKDELLFDTRLKAKGAKVYTCTNDGSCGFKGFATHRVLELIEHKEYDWAVVCGPEVMMRSLYGSLEAHMIDGEYSMERYMKCAIGVCGQCCVDNTGWRICAEGPVFSSDQVSEIVEFGKFHRTASGLKEYF